MAWTPVTWACGHSGAMQLYGKYDGREATVAREAGRQCFACWLVAEWESKNDPRAKRPDRYKLAAAIAEAKGKRIYHLPEDAPVETTDNPLADVSTEDLIAELTRRGVTIES